ncbi:hypothetical protein NYA30BAC_01381 [Halomonas sp. NYA30]
MWSVNVTWEGVTQEVFLYVLLGFQSAVDRIVAIIQADPNKERIDKIITRWLKRHLQRLGADVNLDQLNSLVEDKDMLAENLENWAHKEPQERQRHYLLSCFTIGSPIRRRRAWLIASKLTVTSLNPCAWRRW